jgi:small-conductance mechanosensitive channel
MYRVARFTAAITFAWLLVPRAALAVGAGASSDNLTLHIVVSLVGLVVAVVLLLQALAVRRLARGGAVANKIGYVVLAVLCLAASALAEWGTNFFGGLTLEQANLASELLVIVAMVLLALYFSSVGASMRQYLQSLTDKIGSAKPEPTVASEQKDLA